MTLDQFSVTCPQESDIKLGKLTKRSDTEYRVEIAPNRILKDNNNYTLTITFQNGSTASKKAFLDYSAPEINSVKLNRTSETTAEVSFSSIPTASSTGRCLTRAKFRRIPLQRSRK